MGYKKTLRRKICNKRIITSPRTHKDCKAITCNAAIAVMVCPGQYCPTEIAHPTLIKFSVFLLLDWLPPQGKGAQFPLLLSHRYRKMDSFLFQRHWREMNKTEFSRN